MQRVALDYPNNKFAIVDGVILEKDGNPLKNVASLVFREHEGSYLVGMIAASKFKSRSFRICRRHGYSADSSV